MTDDENIELQTELDTGPAGDGTLWYLLPVETEGSNDDET